MFFITIEMALFFFEKLFLLMQLYIFLFLLIHAKFSIGSTQVEHECLTFLNIYKCFLMHDSDRMIIEDELQSCF
jgi:hypothetical protein